MTNPHETRSQIIYQLRSHIIKILEEIDEIQAYMEQIDFMLTIIESNEITEEQTQKYYETIDLTEEDSESPENTDVEFANT